MIQVQIRIDLTHIAPQPVQTPLREGVGKNQSRNNSDKDILRFSR